jgi:hypothetical protein
MVATPDLSGAASLSRSALPPPLLLLAPASRAVPCCCLLSLRLLLALLLLAAALLSAVLYVQSALYSRRAIEIMCAAIRLEMPG